MGNKKRKCTAQVKKKKSNVNGIWPYMTVCFTELSASSQTAAHVSESRKIRELCIVLKDVLRTYNAAGMNAEHKVCLEKCQKIRDEWRCMWPSLCKGLKQRETQKKNTDFFVSSICVLNSCSSSGQDEEPPCWINAQFCHLENKQTKTVRKNNYGFDSLHWYLLLSPK